MPTVRALIFFVALAALDSRVCGQDWPRFRGPNGSGVSATGDLPSELAVDVNLIWRVETAAGLSSPIIADERLFFTSYREDERTLHCLSAVTGSAQWQQTVRKTRDENFTAPNGPATPTPVTDGTNVYVFYADVGLLAYAVSGEPRWRNDIEPFHSMHGMASSPIVVEGRVVLLVDQLQDSYIAAYDAQTGQLAWKTQRISGVTGGHSTPSIYRPASGLAQLVVSGPLELVGYDAATGQKSWWVSGVSQAPVSLPLVAGGHVYLCEPVAEPVSMQLLTQELAQYDTNKDGKLTLKEMESDVAMFRLLEHIDRDWGNEDGVLQNSEVVDAFGTYANTGGLAAIRLGGSGDLTQTDLIWTYRKSVPYVPSVLVYEDVLYFVQDGGIVTTFRPETGDVLKRARLKKAGAQYYASPVAADGKIFVISTDGKASVLRAGAQWESLSTNDLGETCYSAPAISDGRVYVRTERSLFCFGKAAVSRDAD